MTTWRRSRYTVAFRTGSGDLLLHNSFMGAVARVPKEFVPEIERPLTNPEVEIEPTAGLLHELCANGFFFPAERDERSHVEKVLEQESGDGHQDLILLPHENCNFRCVYCYESHAGGQMTPEVAKGVKRFVENGVGTWSSLGVRWFGGEPLLALRLIYDLSDTFIAACRRAGILYRAQMTTNAYLLKPEVVDGLLQREIRDFQITLDGPAEVHDTTRVLAGGGATFGVIWNNLLAMRQRPDHFVVSLRINFNPDSVPLMENFSRELASEFGDDSRFGIYFRPIGKYGGPNDEHIKVCGHGVNKVIEMDLAEDYSRTGRLDRLVWDGLKSHGQVCYASNKHSLVIGADGTLYKCSVAFDNPANHVGKLLQDGTLDIDRDRWNRWVSTDGLDCGACTSCPLYPLCQSKYCPRSSIALGRPVCPMTPGTYAHLVQIAGEKNS